MPPLPLAALGCLTGAGSISLLYVQWRGARRPWLVPTAWLGVAATILLWSTAYNPDVGTPFAILALTLVALGLVVRGADVAHLARFPAPGRSSAATETAGGPSWSGAAARTLTIILAAPVVGMVLAVLIWTLAPGHASTRFVCAVAGFVFAFAGIQIWGASARRPWRALAMIAILGAAAAAPIAMRGLG